MFRRTTLIASCIVLVASTASIARPIIRRGIPGNGNINIPYMANDSAGNQWTLYGNGMLQQRGNTPVFGQGAMLLLNGESIQNNQNRARQDEKTGEIIFDNTTGNGWSISRRVLISSDSAYVRYIDVVKNTQPQDQNCDVQLQTRINFGVQNSQTIPDPRGKDRVLAYLAQTQANRAVAEIFAGKSAKNGFTITQQPDNNLVIAMMSVTIPAGKEVAFMHLYSTAASLDAATQFANNIKLNDVLKGVSADTRRIIVNFNSGISYIGDREVLRGDLMDVVELRGGDQLKGTLQEKTYTLKTFYGDVQLPADRVIGLLNVGQFRPRQLLVTTDGQVFGGLLTKDSIGLQLSSGQVTQIPLPQMARAGYRKRPSETDDSSTDKLLDQPMVLLRTGDRMGVSAPTTPIEFVTRYGTLKLRPEAVAAVGFQSDDNAVHTVYLTDGSHFAGLIAQQHFDLTLRSAATTQPAVPPAVAGQSVTIPASAMLRLHLTNKIAEADENTPTLQLGNGDLFIGALSGQLKVDTQFDTITVNAGEIKSLSHAKDGGGDVQIELWDQSKLSGMLEDAELSCALSSGDTVKVPVALVDAYAQPQPQPSQNMVEQIKATVTDLAADDWKKRDRAESQLVSMGPVVAGVLKQLSATQPPEAQQRIESILKQLSDKKKPGSAGSATPVVTPND